MPEHPGEGSADVSADHPRSEGADAGGGTASERAERARTARREPTDEEQRAADGWGRQPMASYEAGDSGGWGGPVHQALTGPQPRLRYESPKADGDGGRQTTGSATAAAQREDGRDQPRAGAASPDAPAISASRTTNSADSAASADTRVAIDPADPPARVSGANGELTNDEPAAFEPPAEADELHQTGIGAARAHPGRSRREDDADPDHPRPRETGRPTGPAVSDIGAPATSGMHAVTPVAAATASPSVHEDQATASRSPSAGGPSRRSFRRRVTFALAPIAFWLIVTWLALDFVRGTYALSAARAPDLGPLAVDLVVGSFQVVALACLARLVLEACVHLAELADARRPHVGRESDRA